MQQGWNLILQWMQQHAARASLLLIIIVGALIVSKLASTAVRRMITRTNIPSASIFVNIIRAIIWVLAITAMLQPVFGINPSTLLTALGISGLVLSFGLQTTIANIAGGFGLMAGKVIQPGDAITVNGATGIVKDITWRHTIVRERAGGELWIPNSVLDKAQLEKIPAAGEAMARVEFTVRGDEHLDAVSERIKVLVHQATEGLTDPEVPSMVNFLGFSPFGIKGEIWAFARPGVQIVAIQNAISRELVGQDFLVQDESAGRSPLSGN